MKLLVVQPYLAEYRKPFWVHAMRLLKEAGVHTTLATGTPDVSVARRGDIAAIPDQVSTPSHRVRLGGATVRWQCSWRMLNTFDAAIFEASGSLLDSSVALVRDIPVGLWGHIGSFTGPRNPLDAKIERWQLRRAQGVLAYTARGADEAQRLGVPSERITVLHNTIDTEVLRRDLAAMDRGLADQMLDTKGWERSRTFCFIGGLDHSKRVDFLCEALDVLWENHHEIRILVGGEGDRAHLLSEAVRRGQVKLLGRVDSHLKAALSAACVGILMPGRVGLVAVDSLALQMPIITTDYPFHAPEFDYLTPNVDCLVTEDDPRSYAQAVTDLSENAEHQHALAFNLKLKQGGPTIHDMASNFRDAAVKLLDG